MDFTYSNLKKAANEGMRIGNWKGKGVFAASKDDLCRKGSGAYYIVYDDDNTIVSFNGSGWRSYGMVSRGGTVEEHSAEIYHLPQDKRTAASSTVNFPTVPFASGKQSHDAPIGDVKLEIDVEATLKKAREMTVEDLLAGFNYGMD